ncbi:hypothetical protein [Mucilaginibacter sp.]|jgi:hypothetical protein|uniref:hypothetical protein n=1 Tax=Mucilaginibacter sp. TaxID=1882438 RepID=UPI002BA2320C|nr:hypothetical protein [Mucilaginibacter sp.]HTI59133.1 hypothetical protein [Mucilaginibacter sp.]
MKRLLILLAISVFAITACKKSSVNSVLAGKWELRHQNGGWGYDSTYVAGNGNIFDFYGNNRFKRYEKGALAEQGTFHIQKATKELGSTDVIIFNNDVYGEPLELSNGTLSIGTSAADGIINHYQKIAD